MKLYIYAFRDSHPLDLLSSNHLLETDKLQNEVMVTVWWWTTKLIVITVESYIQRWSSPWQCSEFAESTLDTTSVFASGLQFEEASGSEGTSSSREGQSGILTQLSLCHLACVVMIVNHASLSQICQLRAETLDKEKDFRQKLQVQQKNHAEVVELLQVWLFWSLLDHCSNGECNETATLSSFSSTVARLTSATSRNSCHKRDFPRAALLLKVVLALPLVWVL